MGLDLLIQFIMLLAAMTIALIVYRIAITRRTIAFWSVLVVAPIASLPVFIGLGPDLLSILMYESVAAAFIGGIALLRSLRFGVFLIFMLPISAFALDPFLAAMDAPAIFKFSAFVGSVFIFAPPVFLTLAVVFFVGAFIEKRSYGA